MIVYLHGFNSSAQSTKAQLTSRYLHEQGLGADYACPNLPPLAGDAVGEIERLVRGKTGICYVGSSLGGFYATHMVEKHGGRAVLVNPAIDPHVGLRAYLGPQQNYHKDEPYVLTEAHLREWQSLYAPRITPQRYLLLVETGDEVLDYRRALERYAGAQQRVIEGGDHSLQSFSSHLPRILEFARAHPV